MNTIHGYPKGEPQCQEMQGIATISFYSGQQARPVGGADNAVPADRESNGRGTRMKMVLPRRVIAALQRRSAKGLVAGLIAVAAAAGVGGNGVASASTDSYMSCVASNLANLGVLIRPDSSWIAIGRFVGQHLASGVSPANEAAWLSSKLVSPVAVIVVQCVVHNQPV